MMDGVNWNVDYSDRVRRCADEWCIGIELFEDEQNSFKHVMAAKESKAAAVRIGVGRLHKTHKEVVLEIRQEIKSHLYNKIL